MMSAGEWADNRAASEYTMTAGLCCRALECWKSCGGFVCVFLFTNACTRDRATERNANVSLNVVVVRGGEMLFSFSPALRWFISYALLVFFIFAANCGQSEEQPPPRCLHTVLSAARLSVEVFSFLSSAVEAIAFFIRCSLRRWRYFCFTGISIPVYSAQQLPSRFATIAWRCHRHHYYSIAERNGKRANENCWDEGFAQLAYSSRKIAMWLWHSKCMRKSIVLVSIFMR